MVIGLDIGGSKITGIVLSGKQVVRDLTSTTPKNLEGFKLCIKQLLLNLSASKKIQAIGVGMAGMANANGKVAYSPNMKFLVGFNILEFLQSSGIKKIKIGNDANCFVLAEALLGQGKGLANFIGITLGTGIGAGLISKGRLYGGIHGSAGEVGHMMADAHRDYEALFQQYRDKNNYAAMAKLLGRMFADIYNLLDLEAIILGGSMAKLANRFLRAALSETRKDILNKQIRPKILISKLKNAGAIGAALLI
ncbi:MAG: ROK family protein [Candidatus Doudnabacteria bacterium]|nr:ROK family protein [Candidatus Doudnabacteria bacterium]